VIWTPLAIERIQEIDEYISKDAPIAAANFIDLIFQQGDSLAEHPFLGRKVTEYDRDDYRELIEGNYRIIYRVNRDTIEVVTIFEARRLLLSSKE